jgi:hypothetical protein
MLNTLAEIKRLCVEIKSNFYFRKDIAALFLSRTEGACLELVPSVTSEDFYIYSDGIYYVIIDGAMISLYKIRNAKIL